MDYEKSNGIWIPRLFPKQLEVFNSKARALLVSGPRYSGKTWAVLHKVVRHLWETPGARVALFSKTIKNAKDGGIWEDLISYTLPEWFNANLMGQNEDITFEYTVEPKIDGQTRTLYFKVRNYYGGESELKLFSLDYDQDVQAKVKGTRFSMIWFSELSNFLDRRVFTITKQQLRMPHLRDDQQQWIADTNPADEGADSWIYKVFYEERLLDEPPIQFQTEEEKDGFRAFQKQLGLVEIMIDENPYLTPQKKMEIKSDYHYDPELYAQMVEGKWTGAGGNKKCVFYDVFKKQHVIGDASALNENDWEIIIPSENCIELITGWDLGDTNHSAHIMERIVVGNETHWRVLDELVVIGQKVSISDFTYAFMEKMDFIEKSLNKKVMWRHWSDDSASRYRSAVDDMDSNIVRRASEGRIDLIPVHKPDGTVLKRAHLLRRLLYENRIYFSANCLRTIEMLKRLRFGKTKTEPIERDKHKHPFDSLTYAILMESAYDEIGSLERVTKKTNIDNVFSVRL